MADGYVLRLLKNKRAELVALAQGTALDGIDDAPRAVFAATEDLDRAIGLLEATTHKASDAPKRTRKPRTSRVPRGESDEVFAQGSELAPVEPNGAPA